VTRASNARSAFEAEIRKLVPGAGAMDTQVVTSNELAVPGFTTFEVMLGGSPVRGWARDDGTAVIARMLRYAPILEALQLRDPRSSRRRYPTVFASCVARAPIEEALVPRFHVLASRRTTMLRQGRRDADPRRPALDTPLQLREAGLVRGDRRRARGARPWLWPHFDKIEPKDGRARELTPASLVEVLRIPRTQGWDT